MYFQWKNESMGQDTSLPQGGLRELPLVKRRGTHDNATSCLAWIDRPLLGTKGGIIPKSEGNLM